MALMVSQRNDFRETSVEFRTDDASLFRSRKCFSLVVRRGKFVSANQKRYPNLGGDTSLVWNLCASFSNVICGETTSGVVKCRLFSQAIYFKHCLPVQFYVWNHEDEFILSSKNTDASVNEIPDSGKKQGLSTSKAGTWCTSNNAKFGLKKRSN